MNPSIEKKLNELISCIENEKESMHPLQLKILQNDLENIRLALGVKDTFVSLNSTNFLMWEYSIKSAHKEIYALATNRGSKSGHGFSIDQKLLDVQSEAIRRGVAIHRLFALDKEQYKNGLFMDLLRGQLGIGIDVWLAHDNVIKYLSAQEQYEQENYVIVDDSILYRSYIEKGEFKNSVSFDSEIAQKYLLIFKTLLDHSYQFNLRDLPKDFDEI